MSSGRDLKMLQITSPRLLLHCVFTLLTLTGTNGILCVCLCLCHCVHMYVVYVTLCVYVHTYMYNYYPCSVTSSCFHGDTFIYGFDNSSIHTWFNKTAATTSNKCCLQSKKSYSYLSLDDCDNENHSLITAERK